jgi:hypothetical protein
LVLAGCPASKPRSEKGQQLCRRPKKSAKKATTKSVGHHHEKHHQANDLRRVYEHMGRVDVLLKSLESSAADAVGALGKLAQKEIKAGHNTDAADLLRASEHLSFAFLAGDRPRPRRLSAELEKAITEKIDELTQRADEHWEDEEQHSSMLAGPYLGCRESAVRAFKKGAYHQALEFARAAEALAHVRQDGQRKLATGLKKL